MAAEEMVVKTDRNTMHGPHMNPKALYDAPGIYLVLGYYTGYPEEEPNVVEVVACDAVRSHIIEHKSAYIGKLWRELGYEKICYGAIYMDGAERDAFAQDLRAEYRLDDDLPHVAHAS